MSEHAAPQPRRMQQPLPEDRGGWREISAGPHLHVIFHPNRSLARREPDEIERPSIMVAVAGKREQALRFDPFSVGSHYHIRPGLAGQIPLEVAEGQSPLDAALGFFEKPLRFRGLLAQAEEDQVASNVNDADLAAAARQIREIHAAAAPGSQMGLLARIDRIERRLERIEAQRTPA
ncbi:MAG: DUF7700 domain-containing protein [Stellaceae bacterium]